jgi:hypothetical protein
MILTICLTIIALALIAAAYSGIVHPKERKLELDRKRWALEREKSDYLDKSLRELQEQTDYVALGRRLEQAKLELESRVAKDPKTPRWMESDPTMRQERM